MTLSQRQRDLFQTYLDNHEDTTLDFAGDGQGRKLEIQAQMQDTVRVNIAQIEIDVMIAALAEMMDNAIGWLAGEEEVNTYLVLHMHISY